MDLCTPEVNLAMSVRASAKKGRRSKVADDKSAMLETPVVETALSPAAVVGAFCEIPFQGTRKSSGEVEVVEEAQALSDEEAADEARDSSDEVQAVEEVQVLSEGEEVGEEADKPEEQEEAAGKPDEIELADLCIDEPQPTQKSVSSSEVDFPLGQRLREPSLEVEIPAMPLHSTQIDGSTVLPLFELSGEAPRSTDRISSQLQHVTVTRKSSRPRKRRKLFNPDEIPDEDEPVNSPRVAVQLSQDRMLAPPKIPKSQDQVKSHSKTFAAPKVPPKHGRKKKQTQNKATQKPSRVKSRDSSELFTPAPLRTQTEASHNSTTICKYLKIFVCSGLDRDEVAILKELAVSLEGRCKVDAHVTPHASHVITKKPYPKTEKLLLALIYGTWVLDYTYITQSREAGHWLNEDGFEIKGFLPAVGVTRFERQTFGPSYKLSILKGINIFISSNVKANKDSLANFVTLLGGSLVDLDEAKYVIADEEVVGKVTLASTWITDSIGSAHLKPPRAYLLKPVSQRNSTQSNTNRRSSMLSALF